MARPRTPAGRARRTARAAGQVFPGTAADLCALDHADPFQLLVATILSAQCTDERVNLTTPALFARYPDAAALAARRPGGGRGADPTDRVLPGQDPQPRRHGQRGRRAVRRARCPRRWQDLVTLPGVGRKTANVVRSVAFDLPGLPVDTHVQRLSRRLGLTDGDRPGQGGGTRSNAMVPAAERGVFSLRLILHGRATCRARSPRCDRVRPGRLLPVGARGARCTTWSRQPVLTGGPSWRQLLSNSWSAHVWCGPAPNCR